MTPAQIKANQKLCRHNFDYEEINKLGPFAKCTKGCGLEWGETAEYRYLQENKPSK